MPADPIDIAVSAVLSPLLERARELGEPILRYVPDMLEEEAGDALVKLVSDLFREGLGLLLARGIITVETSGEITLTAHKGPHPDDT